MVAHTCVCAHCPIEHSSSICWSTGFQIYIFILTISILEPKYYLQIFVSGKVKNGDPTGLHRGGGGCTSPLEVSGLGSILNPTIKLSGWCFIGRAFHQ